MSQKNPKLTNTATCADTICLSVQNNATQQADFYLGQADVLDIKLVNATGSDIDLKNAKLEIFFLKLNVGLSACHIDLPGWSFKAGTYSLTLTYSGAAAEWGQGDFNAIQFQISGVKSSLTQARAGFLQINFSGITGQNVPGRQKTPLSLMAAPQPGNAKLDLSVELDDGGIVYVSQLGSLVANRLLLNVTNKGAKPLFSGTAGQQGSPQITVSFVYGTTPGALAPDADKNAPQSGSAWNIRGKESVSEGNEWVVTNPSASGSADDPVWLLTPAQTNSQLIGTGQNAAVQFEFEQVISQTQPGVTLMYVLFSGFKKDDHTPYDDQAFVLTISKEKLPAPGLIRFSSAQTLFSVSSSSQTVEIPLFWSMTGVAKIKLKCVSEDIPGIKVLNPEDLTVPYGGIQPPLQQDNRSIQLQGISQSGTMQITCTAYDANDVELNNQQQTIDFDFPPIVTSYTAALQTNGMQLQWQVEGAENVTINSIDLAATGHMLVPLPLPLLLNNKDYAVIANGPIAKSTPCLLSYYKQFDVDTLDIGFVPGAILAGQKYLLVAGKPGMDAQVSVIGFQQAPPLKVNSSFDLPGEDRQEKEQEHMGLIQMAIQPKDQLAYVSYFQRRTFFSYKQIVLMVATVDLQATPPFTAKALPENIFRVIQDDTNNTDESDWVDQAGQIAVSGPNTFITLTYQNQVIVLPGENKIDVGTDPAGIAITPNGDYAFVANHSDNTVSAIKIKGGPPFQVLSTLTVGDLPRLVAVSPKADYAWVVGDAGTISLIDLRKGEPFSVLTNDIGEPWTIWGTDTLGGIAFSPSGEYAFITCTSQGTVRIFDLRGDPPFQELPHVAVGNSPTGITVSPDGNYVFVANGDTTISIIRMSLSAF